MITQVFVGKSLNIKITSPSDIDMARAILNKSAEK